MFESEAKVLSPFGALLAADPFRDPRARQKRIQSLTHKA